MKRLTSRSTTQTQSTADKVESVKANLPKPEDPPAKSDFHSHDTSAHDVGSGGQNAHNPETTSSTGTNASGAATGDSVVRTSADTYHTETAGLSVGRNPDGKPPSDAVAGDKKKTQGVEQGTENPDYGYPHKNDPSSGVDGPTRRE